MDTQQAVQERIAAENAAEKAATEKLVASGSLLIGMVVERRAENRPEWREGYITSLRPLKVTCTQSPHAESFEWDGVRPVSAARQDELKLDEAQKAARDRFAAENAAAKAATQRLIASGKLSVGMLVERRDGGNEWRKGYITSLRPLTVTCTPSPSDKGLTWDGVRPVQYEKLELEPALEPAPEPALEPAPEPELRSDSELADGNAGSSHQRKLHRDEIGKSNRTQERGSMGTARRETSPVRRELAELRALWARTIGPEQPESSHMPAARSDPWYRSDEDGKVRNPNSTQAQPIVEFGDATTPQEDLGSDITDRRVKSIAASVSSPRSPHLEELCSILQISTLDGERSETLPDSGGQEKASAEQQWKLSERPQLPKSPAAPAQQLELEDLAQDLEKLCETEKDVLAMEVQLQLAKLELARRQCIVGSEAMDAATRLCASQLTALKSQAVGHHSMLSSAGCSNQHIPEAVPPAAE